MKAKEAEEKEEKREALLKDSNIIMPVEQGREKFLHEI